MCLFINLHSVLPINSKEDTRVAFDGDSWESADCARLLKSRVSDDMTSGASTQNDPQVQIICITWKIVVLTLDCNQNLSLCFLWRFWPSFVNVKSSMIYMTKMQIRVRKIFRNYLVNNSLHEKGSNPKNSFSTWYDQIYCLKANHQNYDISLKLTKHFIKKYSS